MGKAHGEALGPRQPSYRGDGADTHLAKGGWVGGGGGSIENHLYSGAVVPEDTISSQVNTVLLFGAT